MKTDIKNNKTVQTAVHMLQENIPTLIAVIVFGSFGTKFERNNSDLDLAILTKWTNQIEDPVSLWKLAQKVAIEVGRDVDIVNLKHTTTVFSFQILTSGTVVYCNDDLTLANFDNLTMTMYQRLQEERKDILEDYERGSFYVKSYRHQ